MSHFSEVFSEFNPIGSTFALLLGLPAWGVQKGYGSMLTFEFGSPHLLVREPLANPSTENPKIRKLLKRRNVTLHGEWNLWIYRCHWRCSENGDQRSTDSSSDADIIAAAEFMNGQQLSSIEVDAPKRKSIFKFDLGATLETWPYESGNEEQWMLFTPSGYVLTYRADGQYSWCSSDQTPDEERWLPLRTTK
jgi:hypothetical protein